MAFFFILFALPPENWQENWKNDWICFAPVWGGVRAPSSSCTKHGRAIECGGGDIDAQRQAGLREHTNSCKRSLNSRTAAQRKASETLSHANTEEPKMRGAFSEK